MSSQAVEIARAQVEAAKAALKVALLADPGRGCSEPSCPGPLLHGDGSCPMGWAGSCRRSR